MLLHFAALGVVWLSLALAERFPVAPDKPAVVELLIGTNAAATGGRAVAAPELPPPTPAVKPAATAVRPAEAERAVAPPAPPLAMRPASDGELALANVPPAAPVPPSPAAEAPTPPTSAAPPEAAAPPRIRIGDGIAATYAEIEKNGEVQQATSETGNMAPVYPLEAARRGEQGTVVLHIFIAADGSVSRVEIARSSGWALLDRSARDQIATWHFRPATYNGKPVESVEEQAIRFLP